MYAKTRDDFATLLKKMASIIIDELEESFEIGDLEKGSVSVKLARKSNFICLKY